MPLYDFICPLCGKEEEVIQKIEDANPVCPNDNTEMKKQISKISIRKGAGIYSIDPPASTKLE